MHIVSLIVLVALAAAACADCGCLKCGKNLRVVSSPTAPVTVIYRGHSCNCPKPIPYTIEVPKRPVCNACPVRTYGYQVQTVKHVKHVDPKYSYGYEVEIPVEKKCGTRYLYGLVAATDRIVMPAVDDCHPEKPCTSPTFEYIQPCNDADQNYYHRRKRDVFTRNDPQLSQPQGSLNHNFILPRRKNQPKSLRTKLRLNSDSQSRLDKPFRVNVPLETKRRFFPFRKSIPKFKGTFDKLGLEKHPARASKVKEDELVEILRRSAKFSDVDAIQITDVRLGEKILAAEKRRQKRSLIFGNSSPFYKVSESSGESVVGDRLGRDKKGGVFMEPFNLESLIPHDQLFYVLNAPIRMLSHVHKMKEHMSPVVKSVPKVLDTSKNYVQKFGKQLKRDVLEVVRNVLDSIKFLPAKAFMDVLRPPTTHKRNFNPIKNYRQKRAIFKLVDEDDIYNFLREKLSIFTSREQNDEEEEDDDDMLKPVTYERVLKSDQNAQKSLVFEQLQPKLTMEKGKPIIDVDTLKKTIEVAKRKSNEIFKRPKNENVDIMEAIADIIQDVKLMAVQPSRKLKKIEMPLHVIKGKISQILTDIQILLDTNCDVNSSIYQNLLKLQNLKNVVTDDWKNILISKRHNGIEEKIVILNKIHEMQSLKEIIVTDIAEDLSQEDVDAKKLIKILVRLQKFQCVLIRIVEYFSERVHYQTPFDVHKEIKYVDYLHDIKFVEGKNCIEVGNALRRERERRIEKQIKLLENLRNLLEIESHGSSTIEKVAKLLWEIKNTDKLQKDTITELHEKVRNGQKIRRELKIIFDLQKQLENCEEELDDLLNHKKSIDQDAQATEPTVAKPNKFMKLKRNILPVRKRPFNLFQKKAPMKTGLVIDRHKNDKI